MKQLFALALISSFLVAMPLWADVPQESDVVEFLRVGDEVSVAPEAGGNSVGVYRASVGASSDLLVVKQITPRFVVFRSAKSKRNIFTSRSAIVSVNRPDDTEEPEKDN